MGDAGMGDSGGSTPPLAPPPLDLGGPGNALQPRAIQRRENGQAPAMQMRIGGFANFAKRITQTVTQAAQSFQAPGSAPRQTAPVQGGSGQGSDWFMQAYWKQSGSLQSILSKLNGKLSGPKGFGAQIKSQNAPASAPGPQASGKQDGVSGQGNPNFSYPGYNIPKKDPGPALRQLPPGVEAQVKSKVGTVTGSKKETESADVKVSKSKAAAVAPANENKSHEAKGKVTGIQKQGKPRVDPNSAKRDFSNRLNQILPGDEDGARNFIRQNRGKEVTDIAKGAVQSQTSTVSTQYSGISQLPGNTQALGHTPLGGPEAATEVPLQNLGENTFAPLEPEHGDYTEMLDVVDDKLAEVEAQLGVEPGQESTYAFMIKEDYDQLNAEVTAASVADIEPQLEAKKASIAADMNTAETTRRTEMDRVRTTGLEAARADQESAKGSFETQRQALTDKINTRYETAKTFVEGRLQTLNSNMSGMEGELNNAVQLFYEESDDMFDDMSGIGGGISGWDWSVFSADWAKEDFDRRIGAIVDKYTGFINTAVEECHGEIDRAKADIEGYIANFESTVGSLEDGAYSDILNDLEKLRSEVDAEGERLHADLMAKKEEAVEEVEAYIESLANPWKILLQGIMDIILTIGEPALRLLLKMAGIQNADPFINAIREIAGVIVAILSDPFGFARNLFQVMINTFTNYFKNIGDNMSEIIATWFFKNPDLQLPKDFSSESWAKFAMDVAGVDANSMGDAISTDMQLPNGASIDTQASIQALLTGGPSALWDNLKGQLEGISIVETPETAGEGSEGEQDKEEISDEEVRNEMVDMSWESFLVEAEQFLPAGTLAGLDKATQIYQQFMAGNISELMKDMSVEMGAEFANIPNLIKTEIFEWVKTDMLQQLPLLVAAFVNPVGGIAKAVKSIFIGVMWCVNNREAIWEVIKSIFGSIPKIVSGDLAGAEEMITAGLNQGLGLLLDLLTTVVVTTSPSAKLSGIVAKLGQKVSKVFSTVMKKFQAMYRKFILAVQKAKGKRKAAMRKDRASKNSKDKDNKKAEKDYRGKPIPNEKEIDAALRRLREKVRDKAPIQSPLPDYGRRYNKKVKTYKVLQALEDIYTRDDSYMSGKKISKKDAEDLAAAIKRTHSVFKWFRVVDDEDSETGLANADKEYWLYQWSASPTFEAKAGEQVFKHEGEDYATEDDIRGDDKILPGSAAKKIVAKKDGNLPSAGKIIRDAFSGSKAQVQNKQLENKLPTLDRPHSVSADMKATPYKDRTDEITSDIGRLGSQEMWLREGKKFDKGFDGGHLIGAKILGPESVEGYNIAPQEAIANQQSYNNTIEHLIRSKAKEDKGASFSYEVEVTYPNNLFSIDQQTLVNRGVISQIDLTKPWNIQIPTRIPSKWKATAKISTPKKWDKLNEGNSTKKKKKGNNTAVDNTALDRNKEGERSAFDFKGENTETLTFYMTQVTPIDSTPNPKPPGSGKENSLDKPEDYETKPKDVNKMRSELKGMAQQLKKDVEPYLKAMKNDGGAKKGDVNTIKFNVPQEPPTPSMNGATTYLNGMKTKAQGLSGANKNKVKKFTNGIDSLGNAKELDQRWTVARQERRKEFDKYIEPPKKAFLNLRNSFEDVEKELGQMLAKANTNFSSISNAKVSATWKELSSLTKRAKLLTGTTAADRITELKNSKAQLGKQVDKAKEETKETSILWTKSVKDEVQRLATSHLSAYLDQLGVEKRKSKRKAEDSAGGSTKKTFFGKSS